MRRIALFLIVGAALLLPAPATYATPITFVATLTGANEVPPTGSPGTGQAKVVLDPDPLVHTMTVDVMFSGLLGFTTASHIHCCLASPFATGVNVMVATTTPTFPGFPLMVQSGTYHQVFDLTLASTYNPAFISSPVFNPSGTVAGAEAALVNGIENGLTYLNIHTGPPPAGPPPAGFPGGEIRGFLVPEPASLVLFGSGLAGLVARVAWRKRRQVGAWRMVNHCSRGWRTARTRMQRWLIGSIATAGVAIALVTTAAAGPVTLFSTGSPDGKIATLSRPAGAGLLETETADDFILGQRAVVTNATFVGLLPTGASLSSVTGIEIELYHVFPVDSTNPPDGRVLTRNNSPSDNQFAAFDSALGSLSFSATILNPSFTAANSVVNGIHAMPNQFTGGEGAVTGEEVQFEKQDDEGPGHPVCRRRRNSDTPPRGPR